MNFPLPRCGGKGPGQELCWCSRWWWCSVLGLPSHLHQPWWAHWNIHVETHTFCLHTEVGDMWYAGSQNPSSLCLSINKSISFYIICVIRHLIQSFRLAWMIKLLEQSITDYLIPCDRAGWCKLQGCTSIRSCSVSPASKMKRHETFPVTLSTETTPWTFNYLCNMENHWQQKLGVSLTSSCIFQGILKGGRKFGFRSLLINRNSKQISLPSSNCCYPWIRDFLSPLDKLC